MNKLNNIVVENLSLEFGQELKKTFFDFGFNIRVSFSGCKDSGDHYRYYGIINSRFCTYSLEEIYQSSAKILTLEELKAMKNIYPKEMYVSDSPITKNNEGYLEEVLKEIEIENQSLFITKRDKSFGDGFFVWKYAKDVEQIKEITLKDILSECKEAIESKFGKLENLKIKQ